MTTCACRSKTLAEGHGSPMGTPTLADLGYTYVPVPTGDPDDFVLRSADGGGFEWKGQANYDAVGAAAVAWIREQLVAHCGLHAVPCAGGATAYSSSGLKGSSAPLLLLVCGSAPGGDAGVWGRSLCINDSTRSGAMFGYVRRAQRLGWGVLIADPHGGDGCPHAHLAQLWCARSPSLQAGGSMSQFSPRRRVGASVGGRRWSRRRRRACWWSPTRTAAQSRPLSSRRAMTLQLISLAMTPQLSPPRGLAMPPFH